MTAQEFFEEVKDALGKTESTENTGVDFFISDMEKLFAEWESEEH